MSNSEPHRTYEKTDAVNFGKLAHITAETILKENHFITYIYDVSKVPAVYWLDLYCKLMIKRGYTGKFRAHFCQLSGAADTVNVFYNILLKKAYISIRRKDEKS